MNKLKRISLGGIAYLINNSDGVVVAKSLKSWGIENGYTKEKRRDKRKYIEKFIAANPDNTFFIKHSRTELYITLLGEQFMAQCNNALHNNPKVVDIKVGKKRQSIEQLDDGSESKKSLYEITKLYAEQLGSMSLRTYNPISVCKSFMNPVTPNTRVFLDMYREIDGIHEGYIIFGGKATLNGAQTYVMNSAKVAAMKKEYGDNMKIIIVASAFDKAALKYCELNVPNSQCLKLSDFIKQVLQDVVKYYGKDATWIVVKNNWSTNYKDVLSAGGVSLSDCLTECSALYKASKIS